MRGCASSFHLHLFVMAGTAFHFVAVMGYSAA